jgi:hypothetical protein
MVVQEIFLIRFSKRVSALYTLPRLCVTWSARSMKGTTEGLNDAIENNRLDVLTTGPWHAHWR